MHIYSLSLNYHKVFALVAMTAMIVWSFGFPSWVHTTSAANLTTISDTISTANPSSSADHTIQFTNPNAIAEGDTIVLTFDGSFNLSTSTAELSLNDFDFATTSDYTLAADCAGSDHMSVATSGQTITFTVCAGDGGAIPAAGTSTIEIGTNATSGGTGDNQIINPSNAQSYELVVTTDNSDNDTGRTRVAIIDDVLVTASVDTILTFIVSGLANGATVNSSPTTTATTTTATTLPFETLAPGVSKTLAQSLSVTTNARNGYTVTANMNQNLTSSTGADIDSFIDDAGTSVATAWVGPTGTLGSENEYGHIGITSEDTSLSGAAFGADQWAGNFVNNPREVMYHTGPADGVTTHQGSTTVGYQAEIMSFQEAGSDYTATITYVATPVF